MTDKKAESVYSILSKVVNLKFYSQLKDSGIELKRIYSMINLSTGKKNYLLEVNDAEIRFDITRDFIYHFINFPEHNISILNERYNELTTIMRNEFTDEMSLEMKCKEVNLFRFKQKELLGNSIVIGKKLLIIILSELLTF